MLRRGVDARQILREDEPDLTLPQQTNSTPTIKEYPMPVVPVGGAATVKTAPTMPAIPAPRAVPASSRVFSPAASSH